MLDFEQRPLVPLDPMEMPVGVSLRPAGSGDGEVLTSLLSEFGAPRTPPPERMEAVLRTFDDHLRRMEAGEARTTVAELDGTVVGVCSLEWRDPFWTAETHAWLPDLIVTESARGRGIGRALLADAVAAAVARGASQLSLESGRTRLAAHGLYRSAGFLESRSDLPTAAGRAVSDYLRRLPIGQRVSTAPLTGNELWPFDSDLETVAVGGAAYPGATARRSGWRGLLGMPARCRLRRLAGRALGARHSGRTIRPAGHRRPDPRAHHDLEDLPAELAAELGPMIQRVARAIGLARGRRSRPRQPLGRRRRALPRLVPRPAEGDVAAARRVARRLGRPPAQGAAARNGIGTAGPWRRPVASDGGEMLVDG